MNACDMEKSAEAYFRSMADEKHGQLTRGNCIPPTTNDPQAKYGDKPEERKPLLSDDEFTDIIGSLGSQSGHVVRDWYESKITSGELMVVKTTVMDDHAGPKCRSCGYVQDYMYVNMKFCPGCGAVLIE